MKRISSTDDSRRGGSRERMCTELGRLSIYNGKTQKMSISFFKKMQFSLQNFSIVSMGIHHDEITRMKHIYTTSTHSVSHYLWHSLGLVFDSFQEMGPPALPAGIQDCSNNDCSFSYHITIHL
jgi:hypothetical protein